MFPAFDETALTIATAEAVTLSSEHVGRSFEFDYKTERFVFANGSNKGVMQVKAIEQWIELFIRTVADRYAIYNSEFGVRLDGLIGYRLPRSYVLAEIKKRITNGILTGCPAVVSVTEWTFDKGTFSFTVTTSTGEEVKIINDI